MKIIIFGGSGSGTTTLGKFLELHMGIKHLDVDDYYWVKTDPPFQEKVPFSVRNENLLADYTNYDNVVMSGSLVSWGDSWRSRFDLGVFLYLPQDLRIKRLQEREFDRYGQELLTNQQIADNSAAFVAWAKKYDDPTFEGRSLTIHRKWISEVGFPVIELIGDLSLEDKMESIQNAIKGM